MPFVQHGPYYFVMVRHTVERSGMMGAYTSMYSNDSLWERAVIQAHDAITDSTATRVWIAMHEPDGETVLTLDEPVSDLERENAILKYHLKMIQQDVNSNIEQAFRGW